MAIIEFDLRSGDKSLWHPKRNNQLQIDDYNTQPSTLIDTSSFGTLYQKNVKFTAVDSDRVMVSVYVTSLDDEGNPIPGTSQDIDDHYILSGQEINDANIVVGCKKLSFVNLI